MGIAFPLRCAAVTVLLAVSTTQAATTNTAYVTSDEVPSGKLYPIPTATNLAGTAITVGGQPWPIAITRDGTTAYVAHAATNNVFPIDTATDTAGTPIPVGNSPQALAITPDGKTAYVANVSASTVTPIDIATNTAGTPIPVGGSPYAIAITPDGTTAYIAILSGSPNVRPIDTATNATGTPIALPGGFTPTAMAITPDGRTVYVASDSGTPSQVIPIDTATNTAGTPIATGTGLSIEGIAITPDGETAFTANNNTNTSTPIDIATNTAGTAIPAGSGPSGIAITPDGKTAYVADNGGGVTPIDVATKTAGTLIGLPLGNAPLGVAVTPDQPPVAALTIGSATAGQAASFDASGSTDPDGTIVSYAWAFGDGATQTATSPTTTHTYATAGNYTATVTAIDNAGCSTALVFTGQTASCSDSPGARASHQVAVAAAPSPPPPSPSPSPSPASPTLSTAASAGVVLGGSVHDTATLAGGSAPGGLITFKLFGPGDATCSGAAVFADTKAVLGNAAYGSSAFTPERPGTYRFTAAYSGDATNNAASAACNALGESVTVAAPAITHLRVVPQRFRAKRGATMKLTVNTAVSVRFALQRTGSRHHRAFSRRLRAGRNAVHLSARGLRPGRYVLRARPVSAAGRRFAQVSTHFAIVAG
jgi:YVTN family beta-propeller protein